jgi:protein-S-isoprenylcysteine O-methyltransferase Ste14
MTNASTEKKPAGSDTSRTVVRWAVRETMGVAMMAVILMLCAGRWDWAWGWAPVIIMAAWVVGTGWTVIPRYPQLLADRVGPQKGAKQWDTALMGFLGVLVLAGYIVAGLDQRNGWTPDVAPLVRWIALAVAAAGYALTVWATASNAFFSSIVRIQSERGHAVATGGPYRFLRHPSYLGQIAAYLATPVVLGSGWALLIGAVCAVLIVVRTVLEDRTLLSELAGYKAYAGKVRFRLLPGIW